MKDLIREFLQEKGCPNNLIEGGLSGLVESWERIVDSIVTGYSLTLDDYLNDLDLRQLLDETLNLAPAAEKSSLLNRVQEADEQMQAVTLLADECLWGNEVAAEEGWTPQKNWWYYRIPQKAGEDLRQDLAVE